MLSNGVTMADEILIKNEEELKSKIYTIRGVQVMLDSDLAEIYGYETKRFNEQVKTISNASMKILDSN